MSRALILALLLVVTTTARADAPETEALLRRALAPEKLGFRAGEATLAMQLRDASGRVVERKMRARTALAEGTRRMRLTFVEPIDQKGVELLIIERRGAPTEQTLWLPRARELRPIAASDRGGKLQGSDFTFQDFEQRELGKATLRDAGEETMAGVATRRIEASAVPGGFEAMTFWVAKDSEIPLKIEFKRGGAVVRRFEVKKLQKVDGRVTPTRLVMSDELAGTKTTLELSDFRDVTVPESALVPDALGR